jgi:hypothetical protein
MKPIIRFTIGKTSKEGVDCLRLSIKNLIKLYKEEFEIYVCYNNINIKEIKWINDFPIKLVDQNKYKNTLEIQPINHPCWKLYPPRLDVNNYEIFIDNDLLLSKRLDFDKFVKNNEFFMSEAILKSYGTLQNKINKQPYLNSGLFGIPAGFDFQKEINSTIKKLNIKWQNSHYEEQAVVAYIFNKYDFKLISLDEIYVCYKNFRKAKYGYHFVGLNKNNHKFWKSFNSKMN